MEIVARVPGKAYALEARAVQDWVRDNIRYTRDVNNVETIATPEKTMEFGQGDCDDQAVLVAALLESIGHPTRFRAIACGSRRFNHVLTETKIGTRWLTLETTESWPMGHIPPNVRQSMIEHN